MFFKNKKETPALPDFDKDGFPDFIKKEIFMQADLIKSLVERYVKADKINFDYLKIKTDKIRNVYIISSTQYYSVALAGAYNFEVLGDVYCQAELISEFNCSNPKLDKSTLVIALCKDEQECINAKERAEKSSAKFIGIYDFCPENKNGININFVSKANAPTASVTLRFIALTMLSLYFGEKKQVITELYSKISVEKLFNLNNKVKNIILREFDFKELGGLLKDKSILFTGTNVDFACDLYGSYISKKISANTVNSVPLGSYEDFFNREDISIFLASNTDFYQLLENRKVSLTIAPESLEKNKNVLGFSESIPLLNPVLIMVCIQLIVYYIAN